LLNAVAIVEVEFDAIKSRTSNKEMGGTMGASDDAAASSETSGALLEPRLLMVDEQ
jgi:hypothetical protein